VELELIRGAHNKVTQLKFHLSPKNHVQLARDDDDSKKSRRRKTSVMDSLELDDHQAVLTARQVSYYADLLGGANEAYAEKKGYKSHEFFNWLRANKFAPKGPFDRGICRMAETAPRGTRVCAESLCAVAETAGVQAP
jgi:hypothetical protein